MGDYQMRDYRDPRASPPINTRTRFAHIEKRGLSRRTRLVCIAISACILPYLFFTVMFPARMPSQNPVTLSHKAVEGEKLAILTYLSSITQADKDPKDDNYFQAARLLGWQLLHANETRIRKRNNIDYVVLVAEDVSQTRRDILQKDGAVVIPVKYLTVPGQEWLFEGVDAKLHPEWLDLMTKLRAWQLTQYSRVLFVDSDTILTNCCIEDIFDDPGSFPVARDDNGVQPDDEFPIPNTYLMATLPEPRARHSWPPTFRWGQHAGYADIDYLCAGFFIFAPSLEMFEYYRSLISLKGRFDSALMEQNLLNYAHRRHGGKAPWQNINYRWNTRFPKYSDIEGPNGAISVHEKWWKVHMDSAWENRWFGKPLQPLFTSFKTRMDEYYEAREPSMRTT